MGTWCSTFCILCEPGNKQKKNEGEAMGVNYLTQKIGMAVSVADYAKVLTVAKETSTPIGVLARGAFRRGLAEELHDRRKAYRKEQAVLAKIEELRRGKIQDQSFVHAS